jgi:hypothetical protein
MNLTKTRESTQVLRKRVNSSCSTSGTHRVTLVINQVVKHELRDGRVVITTNGKLSYVGDHKTFEVITST